MISKTTFKKNIKTGRICLHTQVTAGTGVLLSSPGCPEWASLNIGWKRVPQRCVHILISGAYKYYFIWKHKTLCKCYYIRNLEMSRSSWNIRVAFNPSTSVLIKMRQREHLCIWKRRGQCGHRGKDWNDGATSPGMLTATWAGGSKEWVFPYRLWRKCGLADTWF